MPQSGANIKEKMVKFAAGDVIVKEGDRAHCFFILKSGKVAIFKQGKKLTEFERENATIGELSGILVKPRTATVLAVTDVYAEKIEGDVNILVKENPEIAAVIVLNLAERLDKTTGQLADLSEVFDYSSARK